MKDGPWVRFYDPHVPAHLDYPQTVLPQVLENTAHKYPGHAAILFKEARMTYRALDEAVNRFATGLQRLGVKKGDRVAIHLPNCPQFPIAYFATLRLGAIAVPCNPIYQEREMLYQLNDSGAEVIVTLSNTYPIIRAIRAQAKLRHVIVAHIKTYFPPLLNLLFTVAVEKKKGHRVSFRGDADTHAFTDVFAEPGSRPAPAAIDPEDIAVLMYTGGTTGVSKGAMLTHRNILVNAFQCKAWLNAPDATHVTMVQLPLFHSYGMTGGMTLSVLTAATMVLVPDPRDLKDIIHTLVHARPTLYPGVPAIYNAINNYPDIGKYDLHSIRYCVSGSAGLPREVQDRFQELTGARLVEGYGLSESSPVTHGNPILGDNRTGTIGLPWPDTEVKIVDAETGEQELAIGQEGELCIRGPQVMKGYWNMPLESANALRPDPVDGRPWLYTGDIATMDPDGYFRIVDRKKDVIIGTGGYKIFPREIEEVLFQHPKVLEAAAIGVPMEDKGDRVKVFVVLRPGEHSSPEDIVSFCQERLAPFKVPKQVEFRGAIPKTIVGKPLRRELRAEEAQKRMAQRGDRVRA